MRSFILYLALLFGMALFAASEPNNGDFKTKAVQTTKGKPLFVSNELVVKFHSSVSDKINKRFNEKQGTTLIANLPFGMKHLRLPKGKSPQSMAAVYQKNPNVQFAHPNYIAYASLIPNDYYYSVVPRHWNFDNSTYGGIGMEEAWDEGNAGNGLIVAVLDTGIAYEDYDANLSIPGFEYLQAPELAQTSFVAGFDWINFDLHPNDDNGHGTHVAGTIAQSTNNGTGTAGVAYNVSLMPVKVLGANGSGSSTEIIYGIDFATQSGADVINMSLSFGSYSGTIPGVELAIDTAYNSGVVIVAATGNDYFTNFVSYPANNPKVIAVGATDFYENVTDYSNKGSAVELTAPGGDNSQNLVSHGYGSYGGILQQTISSSDPTSFGYWYYEGTSMATPHVAAVAALVREANPTLNVGEIRTVLQDSAEDHGPVGHDTSYGYGIVDAYQAVLLAKALLTPNDSPVAVIGGDTTGFEDQLLSFNGSGSSDPNDDELTYSWNIDGQLYSGEMVSHTFAWGGTFNVSLTVDDNKGGMDTTSTDIVILEVNDEPVINIDESYNGYVGSATQFDASATTDYDNDDGSIGEGSNDQDLTYSWNFGDGSVPVEGIDLVQVSHEYLTAGDYTLTLSVNDTVITVDETASVSITTQPYSVVEQVAQADIFVRGSVSGTYANTHGDDGVVQTLTERESGGKPSNRYAHLEHQWQFGVQPGDLISLTVDAIADVGESFTFAYSVDGSSFTDMFSVDDTTSSYSYTLPNTLDGTVYIRVIDDTQVQGNKTLHSLEIDQIIIRTETSGSVTPPPSAPDTLEATANSYSQISLTWNDNADNETGFTIERSLDESSWSEIGTTAANITNYIDSGLSALTTYYYRVAAFNSAGSSLYSNSANDMTPEGPAITLSVEKLNVKGVKHVLLTWTSGTATVDIKRDGNIITEDGGTSDNPYDDSLGKKVNSSYDYQVCEAGTSTCSAIVTVYY